MQLSFLIRTSPDQRLFASFPELIAGYHVLHRLSMPRHPPYTLSSLTTFIDHRHNGRVMTCRDIQRSPARLITDRSPKRCSTIPARRKNSWKDGRGDHALLQGPASRCDPVRAPPRGADVPRDDHWWIVTFEPHVFTCQRASCPATATSRSLVVHRHRFCPPNAGKCAWSLRGKLIRVRPTHGHGQIRFCLS